MRETFRGYYRPTNEEFTNLWKNCIFCLDANILLNIYRYSPETRAKFMRILNKVSNRTIIPHQAAKEYQNNRLNVIKEQEDAYDNIINEIQNNFSQIKKELNSFKKHPLINIKNIVDDLDKLDQSIQTNLKEKQEDHPNLFSDDPLRDEITELLKGKISDPCPSDKKEKIKEEVEYRHKNEIPPGFKDYNKDENNCGDLILWFQIVDIAKKEEKPIIFVTDEKKDDWWWKFAGKTIGPRQELVEEIYEKAKVPFYMYRTDHFIEFAEKELFKKDADPEFIEEVKDVITNDKYVNINDHIVKIIPRRESDYVPAYKSNYKTGYIPTFPHFYELQKIKDKLNEIENNESVSILDLDEIENELNSVNYKINNYIKYLQEKSDNLTKDRMKKTYELESIYNRLKNDVIDDKDLEYYFNIRINLEDEIEYLKQEVKKIKKEMYTSKERLTSLNEQLDTIRRRKYNKYEYTQPLE